MSTNPHWWDELATQADEIGSRFSAAWYAAMESLYLDRFPNADQASKDNMRQSAEIAKRREEG